MAADPETRGVHARCAVTTAYLQSVYTFSTLIKSVHKIHGEHQQARPLQRNLGGRRERQRAITNQNDVYFRRYDLLIKLYYMYTKYRLESSIFTDALGKARVDGRKSVDDPKFPAIK